MGRASRFAAQQKTLTHPEAPSQGWARRAAHEPARGARAAAAAAPERDADALLAAEDPAPPRRAVAEESMMVYYMMAHHFMVRYIQWCTI